MEIQLPYDFYEKVEEPGFVEKILYSDSVHGSSKVKFQISGIQYIMTIEEAFDYLLRSGKGKLEVRDDKEYLFIVDENIKFQNYCYKKNILRWRKPLYIMRHKISNKVKKMFIISANEYCVGTEIILTSDHSLVIYSDKTESIEIKSPKEILNDYYNYFLIQVTDTNKYKKLRIRCIKEFNFNEEYVYDISFGTTNDECNTFIINENIVVHNTDSLFIHLFKSEELEKIGEKLEANKESIDNIMDKYVFPVSKKINENIISYWNKNFLSKMNVDPNWNTVDFKTEILMDKILFTGKKKRYACRIYKKEKTYFIPPKIAITGIEIKRSDSAKITKDIMSEIIKIIFEHSDVKEMKKEIKKCVKKYVEKFNQAYKDYDFDYVGIPSSWGIKGYKSIPTYVYGALLYNTFIQDICRPGVKGIRIHVQLNKPKIMDYIKSYNRTSDFQFDLKTFNAIKDKLDVIFLPPDYNKDELKRLVKEKYIKLDPDTQKEKVLSDKAKPLIDVIIKRS